MKLRSFLPAAIAVAGVCGAVLRGFNLHTGYELGTSLPIPRNIPQFLLILLSILVIGGISLLSRSYQHAKGASFEHTFGCSSTLYKMLSVICGALMGVCGLVGFYLLLTEGMVPINALGQPVNPLTTFLPLVPLWLLAILTMVSFIVLASAQAHGHISEKRAIFSLFPMFWACFDLIITFKDNGASPFVSLYVFELFAAIALVFAFYAMAGFFYAKSNPARFLYTAGLAVFFCWTCVGGYLVYHLLGGGAVSFSVDSVLRYGCFAATSIYLLANMFLCTKSLQKS